MVVRSAAPGSEISECSFELITQTFLVAMRMRETLVPIPNTMVKPHAADGTMLETVWESRRPPGNLSHRII